jgi:chromosome segregation ATPase
MKTYEEERDEAAEADDSENINTTAAAFVRGADWANDRAAKELKELDDRLKGMALESFDLNFKIIGLEEELKTVRADRDLLDEGNIVLNHKLLARDAMIQKIGTEFQKLRDTIEFGPFFGDIATNCVVEADLVLKELEKWKKS